MITDSRQIRPRTRVAVLPLAILVVVALALLSIARSISAPLDAMAALGNDDILRLVSVRAWLADGSWFDTTLLRVAPPEGLDLHWSRFVDLAIAAIIWPLSLILPTHIAEAIAVILWPSLLLTGFVALSGYAALRLYGRAAAAVAMVAIVLWPLTAETYFGPGRMDHHGLQVVVMAVMIFNLALPEAPVRRGLVAGGMAAFSLAVGLEMLPAIAVAGLLLSVRAVQDPLAGRAMLAGFGLGLGVMAPLFFAGQTPRAEWGLLRCDALGLPILALSTGGALVALISAAAMPRLSSVWLRVGLLAGLGAAAIALAAPLLSSCIAGPYGDLPPEMQDQISRYILEARPLTSFLDPASQTFYAFVVPPMATIVLATLAHMRGRTFAVSRTATTTLLIFGWLGLLGAFVQIRLLVLAVPALPVLAGFFLAGFIRARYRAPGDARQSLALVAVVGVTLLPSHLFAALGPLIPRAPATMSDDGRISASRCRQADILRSLNTLPPARVMASGNLGVPILLYTDHTVLSAPYHRSAAALAGALLAFEAQEAETRDVLAETGAEYLVLCRGARYSTTGSFAHALAGGQSVPWLTEITGPDPALLVLRVTP